MKWSLIKQTLIKRSFIKWPLFVLEFLQSHIKLIKIQVQLNELWISCLTYHGINLAKVPWY